MKMKMTKCLLSLACALALIGSASGVDSCPLVDLSSVTSNDVIIAQGTPTVYQGHPTTATNENGEIIAVWCTPHGGHCGPAAISADGGRTWTRIDDRFPPGYLKHVNCPSIYRLVDPNGKSRLWVWSEAKMRDTDDATDYQKCRFDSSRAMPSVMSEDGGLTWTEVAPLGEKFLCTMAFTSIVRLKNGNYLGVFHTGQGCGLPHPRRIWQSITADGGFTWSDPKLICLVNNREACEAYVFRSPDGNELCCLMRDENHNGRSMMMFSTDEGEHWTTPIDTPWGLTGDRHQGVQLPDGRLVIAFRDRAIGSSTHGDFVAWVGTYEELKTDTLGSSYRIHLLTNYDQGSGNQRVDCGYPGIELMNPATGEIVATTYIKYQNDNNQQSVVAKRFSITDTDAIMQSKLEDPEVGQDGPVEYIQSDGTQWIDTGIINNTATDEVIIEYSVEAFTTAGIYGARTTSVGDRNFSYMLNKANNENAAIFQCLSGEASLTHVSRARVAVGESNRYRAYGSRQTRYTEDALTGEKLTPVTGLVNEDTVDVGEFEAADTAYLFRIHGGPNTDQLASIRLYSCKILRGGSAIRDFVPYGITTNGVYQGCLYEKCEGKYYISQGAGVFVAGPSVAPEDLSQPIVKLKSLTAVNPMRVSVTYDLVRIGQDDSVSGDVSLIYLDASGNPQSVKLETAATATGVRTKELDIIISADLAQNDIGGAWLSVENSAGKSATSEVLSLQRAHRAQFLPAGYEQLTYVQANGQQAVNTGFYPGANMAIWLRFAVDNPDANNRRLFGAIPNFTSSGANNLPLVRAFLRGTSGAVAATGGICLIDIAGNAKSNHMNMDGPKQALDTEIHEIYASNESMTFDGESSFTAQSGNTGNPLNVTLTKELYLLDWNGGTGNPNKFQGRIYGCKIYDGETIVREFVPVRHGTEVGLYDMAAQPGGTVFYPSITAAPLVAGEPVSADFTLSEVTFGGTSARMTVTANGLGGDTLYAAAGATYGGDDLAAWDATGLTVTVKSGELATGAVVKVSGIPAGAKYLRLYCTTASGLVMWSNPYYLPLVQTVRGWILIAS